MSASARGAWRAHAHTHTHTHTHTHIVTRSHLPVKLSATSPSSVHTQSASARVKLTSLHLSDSHAPTDVAFGSGHSTQLHRARAQRGRVRAALCARHAPERRATRDMQQTACRRRRRCCRALAVRVGMCGPARSDCCWIRGGRGAKRRRCEAGSVATTCGRYSGALELPAVAVVERLLGLAHVHVLPDRNLPAPARARGSRTAR